MNESVTFERGGIVMRVFCHHLGILAALLPICQTSFAADEVADAIGRLSRSTDSKERIEAINALSKLRKNTDSVRAIPILAKVAEDKDAGVRVASLELLALIANAQHQSCPEVLVRALFDRNDEVRGTAFTYLDCPGFKDYSKASLALLLRALEHQDADVRCSIPQPLVRAGGKSKEVLNALEKATKDKHVLVRNNAHVALWDLEKDWGRFVRHLLQSVEAPTASTNGLVKDSSDEKRGREAIQLVALGCTIYLKKLCDEKPAELAPILLKLLTDESPVIRRAAARSLGAMSIDNPKGEKVLKDLNAVNALEKAVKDDDARVRRCAEIALCRITKDWDRIIRQLLESIEKWEEFLAKPKDETAEGKEKYERDSTAIFNDGPWQLIELGNENPRAVAQALIKLLADVSPTVRKCAVRGLGYMAEEKNEKTTTVLKELKAEAALRKLLDDPKFDVRFEAEWTLKNFAK